MSVRVRFAPSPTGYLHVGGARTALYNWLFARHYKGTFILRIEDTDQVRSTEEALQMQLADLRWLGLDWDEGPTIGGPSGPYKQSERKALYREHADRLLESGQAFYCFCDDETLEKKKEAAMAQGLSPHYDGTCRRTSLKEARERIGRGESAAVRFHVKSQKEYVLQDMIRGEVRFPADMVGDFVILRSDGLPVYNFCCVIDDALMKITHVLRAEEHLSNTVRQLMLYEAFGFSIPAFGHLSIMLGADRQKLSKRHGATSCNDFRLRGYLPEALKNFIALSGWSSPSGNEVVDLKNMIAEFDGTRLNPAPAIFDETKLRWMNSVYLRALPDGEVWSRLEPRLREAGLVFDKSQEWKERAISLFKASVETLEDAVPLFLALHDDHFQLTAEGHEVAKTSQAVLQSWQQELKGFPKQDLTEGEFDQLQNLVKTKCQVNGKNLFQPIRVAVVGQPSGVDLKRLVPLLSRDSLIRRAEVALKLGQATSGKETSGGPTHG